MGIFIFIIKKQIWVIKHYMEKHAVQEIKTMMIMITKMLHRDEAENNIKVKRREMITTPATMTYLSIQTVTKINFQLMEADLKIKMKISSLQGK